MMKFFRKYNRHLLAVFMAGLLVIWLGGTALEDMIKSDRSGEVLATSKFGDIIAADTTRVENQTQLLNRLSASHTREGQNPPALSWQQRWGGIRSEQGDQLNPIDWILLQKEAKSLGFEVTSATAKRNLILYLGSNEKNLELVANRSNVLVDRFYEAFADVLAVQEMLRLFGSAASPSELSLRGTARNFLEKASAELIKLPAVSFVDTEQTFTDEAMTAQFNEFKDKHAVPGSTEFGYYIEPAIDLQYIRIDAGKLVESVINSSGSLERQAFRFWQQNKETDPRFRVPTERLVEQFQKQQEATSNGLTPPPLSMFIEDFAEARSIAIDAVRLQKAEGEANRIASDLARKLADPWFDISAEKTEYKAAPDEVKRLDYYDEVIESVSAAKRHADAIEVGLIKNIDRNGLADAEGVGTAQLERVDGSSLPIDFLAFNVEGIATIPEGERIDRSLFISKWQTQIKPLYGEQGSIYLFRAVDVHEGREPTNLDEVRDRVVTDLRLKAGMERAKQAAEDLASKDTGGPLKDIWGGETDLQDKITPDKGGYAEPPAFARLSKLPDGQSRNIDGVGLATGEFIDTVFELAADPDNSRAVAVELPAQAAWVVIKGKELLPLYEETFASQKNEIRRQLGSNQANQIILNWLNKEKIRERCGFKMAG
ncbi:MAG: hypothetical protein DHS20C16_28680 [Phycisphaerae bacterium]|nr:MAG: hypothetical protein DHS20C16_28680 [Phycisphaerae bacterium]